MCVTISLCISGICCWNWKHKLSSLTTLTSKLCNKLSTQFKHLWLVESQTISNPAFLTERERGWLNSPSLVPFSKFTKVSLRIKHFTEMITTVLDYTLSSSNGHLSTTVRPFFLGGLSVHSLLSQPLQRPSLYNGHFFLSPRWLLKRVSTA